MRSALQLRENYLPVPQVLGCEIYRSLGQGHACRVLSRCRLLADTVEKVENTAKTKFSQKLAGGRFLLRMRSSCEEEGRRKLLFKSTWSTVSDGVKRISGS